MAKAERDRSVEPPRLSFDSKISSCLVLKKCEVRLGGNLMLPLTPEESAQISGEIGKDSLSLPDSLILRMLARDFMPITIVGDDKETPLTLDAELARFPYRNDGEEDRESFAVRLMPSSGSIASIGLNPGRVRDSLTLNNQRLSHDSVIFDVGNRLLHLEVYFDSQDPKPLPPLEPAQAAVNLKPDDGFDDFLGDGPV